MAGVKEGDFKRDRVHRGWESLEEEVEYWIPESDIIGRIPANLHGTFLRNGPGVDSIYGTKLKHRKNKETVARRLGVDHPRNYFAYCRPLCNIVNSLIFIPLQPLIVMEWFVLCLSLTATFIFDPDLCQAKQDEMKLMLESFFILARWGPIIREWLLFCGTLLAVC
eukprot:m.174092 g.174092  ORF g.174092 m.174092 type:complete len:166 (+) comp39103_c0_seq2:37-534(+)